MNFEGQEFKSYPIGRESTLANLKNDHEFISKEYNLHRYEAFWRNQKYNYESLYSKWTISYHCGGLWFLTCKI